MPASHQIFHDLNLVFVTFEGCVTLPEILTDYMAYCASPDWHKGQSVFIDTSRVTNFRVTFQGFVSIVKHLVGALDPFDPTILTAIYAPSDLMFAKGKMHQRLTSTSETNCVGVFRENADAFAFLGLTASDLPPGVFVQTAVQ
ncbi:MAG: hypothetical protein MK098_13965 [Marinovum sp.]|nr:hypothetical protein [Marinovum sp.]